MNEKTFRIWAQRLCGVALLAGTVIGIYMTDGDATFALFTIPMGLLCILGKDISED